MSFFFRIYRARWGLFRFVVAAFLLLTLLADHAGRLARLQLASLPDMDFAGEVRMLREEGRFGESVMIADAGLAVTDGAEYERIADERQRTIDEQSSWLRKVKEVGMGALSGRGESLESLAGAVTADLFLVGDIRDLLIQGTRLAIDGEADPFILVLSGIGVVTTLAPEIDWAASLLKIGRKSGAIRKGLADFVVDAAKRGESTAVRKFVEDSATLAKRSSPGTALRALRACEVPEDAAKLASFLERNGAKNGGALALHVVGDGAEALEAIKSGERAEKLLVSAARKGPAGANWLRSGAGRALLRPHPLIGLAKGLYKGNVEALAARVAERIDPHGWWITPLVAAWFVLEAGLLWRRFASAA